eukprot:TRINITY_DN2957_c0_g1_i1.p1 TRINITY_DN2957_c0_g1~~TRINITY_DN2957_c0_g1_i1.p1  ORF type:complete len:621 (+),score=142.90 TRINITY_DN2957_c0_g1_i1:73-1935(+)
MDRHSKEESSSKKNKEKSEKISNGRDTQSPRSKVVFMRSRAKSDSDMKLHGLKPRAERQEGSVIFTLSSTEHDNDETADNNNHNSSGLSVPSSQQHSISPLRTVAKDNPKSSIRDLFRDSSSLDATNSPPPKTKNLFPKLFSWTSHNSSSPSTSSSNPNLFQSNPTLKEPTRGGSEIKRSRSFSAHLGLPKPLHTSSNNPSSSSPNTTSGQSSTSPIPCGRITSPQEIEIISLTNPSDVPSQFSRSLDSPSPSHCPLPPPLPPPLPVQTEKNQQNKTAPPEIPQEPSSSTSIINTSTLQTQAIISNSQQNGHSPPPTPSNASNPQTSTNMSPTSSPRQQDVPKSIPLPPPPPPISNGSALKTPITDLMENSSVTRFKDLSPRQTIDLPSLPLQHPFPLQRENELVNSLMASVLASDDIQEIRGNHHFMVSNNNSSVNINVTSSSTTISSSLSNWQPPQPDSWVRLNVGGKLFQTSRSTLMSDRDSMLAKLVDMNIPSLKDESGAIMIDRDPKFFAPLLNFLRTGRLIIDPNLSNEGLLEEARYYNLRAVFDALTQMLRKTSKKAYSVATVKLDDETREIESAMKKVFASAFTKALELHQCFVARNTLFMIFSKEEDYMFL